ncbi:MAG: FG-GAP repeat protein [Polyangiaceae bacterium]
MVGSRVRWFSALALLLGVGSMTFTGCDVGGDGDVQTADEDSADEATASSDDALTATGSKSWVGTFHSKFGSALAKGHLNGTQTADPAEDLVVGAIGDNDFTGSISVIFGAPGQGLEVSKSVLTQGVGEAEPGDEFGWSIAVGDFNGDHYDDIAVGAPGEDVPIANLPGTSWSDAGQVTVMYGPFTSGQPAWREQITRQTIVANGGQSDERFGWALAAGDFDHNGIADLAIGSPFRTSNGEAEAGQITVLYGRATLGLNLHLTAADGAPGAQILSQSNLQNQTAEAYDRFGFALAAGNFDNAAGDDLAIGSPYEAPGSGPYQSGAVSILYSSHLQPLPTATAQTIHGATAGLAYTAQGGAQFGSSLAAGNTNADAFDDLVVGIPYYDIGAALDAGAALVMRGSAAKLNPSASFLLTQNRWPTTTVAESQEYCGYSVAVGNFNGDSTGDVAFGCMGQDIGSPGYAEQEGAVVVAYGPLFYSMYSPNAEFWHMDQPNVPGIASDLEHFGAAVTAGDFDADGKDDLAAGAPGQQAIDGEVVVLRGL